MTLPTIDYQMIFQAAQTYSIRIVAALAILVLGWFAAKIVRRITQKILSNKRFDQTVASFFGDLIYYVALAVVFIAFLSELGVQTTSLAAVFGAMALAIGLSLKSSISQFTSGLILVGTHPFSVGDFVDVDGTTGTVRKISLMFTNLKSSDNQEIIIPNNKVLSAKIINFSHNDTRRVNITVGIGYEDDIDKAKGILEQIAASDERILKTPKPLIAVTNLGDSSVDVLFRVWVNRADYAQTLYACTETIKKSFDEQGINMPYPQRDVHITNNLTPKE